MTEFNDIVHISCKFEDAKDIVILMCKTFFNKFVPFEGSNLFNKMRNVWIPDEIYCH